MVIVIKATGGDGRCPCHDGFNDVVSCAICFFGRQVAISLYIWPAIIAQLHDDIDLIIIEGSVFRTVNGSVGGTDQSLGIPVSEGPDITTRDGIVFRYGAVQVKPEKFSV